MKCQYCGGITPIEDTDSGEIRENDYDYWETRQEEFMQNAADDTNPPSNTKTDIKNYPSTALYSVKCKQCGATTSVKEEHMAQLCPFCGTPLIIEEAQLCRFWTPNYLIPFTFSQRNCSDSFKKWVKRKWFAPNKALNLGKRTEQQFSGVYIPYWTYDAHAEADYRGQRGEHRTKKDSNGNTHIVTDWYDVSGHIAADFDDILVPAVANLDRNVLMKVNDFPQEAYKPFNHAYLAGFVTEAYTIDFVDGAKDAVQRIHQELTYAAEYDIGGNEQRVTSLDVDITDKTFKLLVLPFWVASFRYNSKTYQIVINGYTGSVYGSFPISGWKIFWLIVFIMGIIALVIYM